MGLIKISAICPDCNGVGSTNIPPVDSKGTPRRDCVTCNGDGTVEGIDDTLFQDIFDKVNV